MMRKTYAFLAVLLALALSVPAPALAHRLGIFAYAEGDTIISESKFASGAFCQHCAVIVRDVSNKETLLTGTTDENGVFKFPSPIREDGTGPDIEIAVDAGGGHSGEWFMAADEYGAAAPSEDKEASKESEAVGKDESALDQEQVKGVDEETLQRVVAVAVRNELAPMKRMLADSKLAGPGPTEIAGGIGYLFGLAGLFAWFKSRGKK